MHFSGEFFANNLTDLTAGDLHGITSSFIYTVTAQKSQKSPVFPRKFFAKMIFFGNSRDPDFALSQAQEMQFLKRRGAHGNIGRRGSTRVGMTTGGR